MARPSISPSIIEDELEPEESALGTYLIETDRDIYYDNDTIRVKASAKLGQDCPLSALRVMMTGTLIYRDHKASRAGVREIYREALAWPMEWLEEGIMGTYEVTFKVPMFASPSLRSKKMIKLPNGALSADVELRWEVILAATVKSEMPSARDDGNQELGVEIDMLKGEAVILHKKLFFKRTLYDATDSINTVEGYSILALSAIMSQGRREQANRERAGVSATGGPNSDDVQRFMEDEDLSAPESGGVKQFLYEREVMEASLRAMDVSDTASTLTEFEDQERNRASNAASRQASAASRQVSSGSEMGSGSRRGTKQLVPKKHVLLRCCTPSFLRTDQVFDVHISTYSTDPRQLQVRRIKAYLRQNVMYKHEKEPILYSTVIAHDKLKPRASIFFPQPAENEFTLTINPAKTRWRDEFLNFTGEATRSSIPVATGIVSDKLNRTLLSVDYTIEIHVSILGGTKIAKSVPVVLESPSVGMVLSSENRVAVQDLPDEAVREPELVEEMDSSDEEYTDEELDEDGYEHLQRELGRDSIVSTASVSASASKSNTKSKNTLKNRLQVRMSTSSTRSRSASSPPKSPQYHGDDGLGITTNVNMQDGLIPVTHSLGDPQRTATSPELHARPHTSHTTAMERVRSSSPALSRLGNQGPTSPRNGNQLLSEAQRVPLPAVSVGAIIPPSYNNLDETSTPTVGAMSVRSRSEQLAAKFSRSRKREKERKKGSVDVAGGGSANGTGDYAGDATASNASQNTPAKHVTFMKKLRQRATTRSQSSSSVSPNVQRNSTAATRSRSGLIQRQLSAPNEAAEGEDGTGLPRYSMISTAAILQQNEDSRTSRNSD